MSISPPITRAPAAVILFVAIALVQTLSATAAAVAIRPPSLFLAIDMPATVTPPKALLWHGRIDQAIADDGFTDLQTIHRDARAVCEGRQQSSQVNRTELKRSAKKIKTYAVPMLEPPPRGRGSSFIYRGTLFSAAPRSGKGDDLTLILQRYRECRVLDQRSDGVSAERRVHGRDETSVADGQTMEEGERTGRAVGAEHLGLDKQITATLLCDTAAFFGGALGFTKDDVSARSLRAAGANALLFANVDTDVIRLIGPWKLDEMLRYLHVQAAPLTADYSKKMITAGSTPYDLQVLAFSCEVFPSTLPTLFVANGGPFGRPSLGFVQGPWRGPNPPAGEGPQGPEKGGSDCMTGLPACE
ncbi:hypothetical protein THAOC_22064 [Thalassiosira oceanica]|uniref:Uncharacterized protein n=1 Tax=Thalassiosira oceanica TaxID=159749 RepID=K0RXY3_THAOC|nr:hypothetical protein THAOC_22064 [Thalassiosira oceanica]|eukprot:EJK57860.1 hypothetical protein THAOC_22064 [Thalassiosira oceanica]